MREVLFQVIGKGKYNGYRYAFEVWMVADEDPNRICEVCCKTGNSVLFGLGWVHELTQTCIALCPDHQVSFLRLLSHAIGARRVYSLVPPGEDAESFVNRLFSPVLSFIQRSRREKV